MLLVIYFNRGRGPRNQEQRLCEPYPKESVLGEILWRGLSLQLQVAYKLQMSKTWWELSHEFDYHLNNKFIARYKNGVHIYTVVHWISLIHNFPTMLNIWGLSKQKTGKTKLVL